MYISEAVGLEENRIQVFINYLHAFLQHFFLQFSFFDISLKFILQDISHTVA